MRELHRSIEVTKELFEVITNGRCYKVIEHDTYTDLVYRIHEVKLLCRIQPSGTNYYLEDINV